MDGAFGRPRGTRKPFINITPLIDVMFLLLIFFMVSSTFRDRIGIDVALPQTKAATQQEASEYGEIVVADDGSYGYNDALDLDESQLEAAMRAELESNPEAVFVLRGDKAAQYERYIAAIGVVKKIGADKLVLQTKPVDAAAQ